MTKYPNICIPRGDNHLRALARAARRLAIRRGDQTKDTAGKRKKRVFSFSEKLQSRAHRSSPNDIGRGGGGENINIPPYLRGRRGRALRINPLGA